MTATLLFSWKLGEANLSPLSQSWMTGSLGGHATDPTRLGWLKSK